MSNRRGVSYQKRVEEVNRIYDCQSRLGLSNREIWRRYIYPIYGISERTFYNLLNASADESKHITDEGIRQLLLFTSKGDEQKSAPTQYPLEDDR